MQGTQYAPRESILCMEHFVALHTGRIALLWCTLVANNMKIEKRLRIKTHFLFDLDNRHTDLIYMYSTSSGYEHKK